MGTITAPTGDYRFSLSGGGDIRVWIDGTRVVSFSPFHEPTQNGLTHLAAGAHPIRVEVTPFQATLSRGRLRGSVCECLPAPVATASGE